MLYSCMREHACSSHPIAAYCSEDVDIREVPVELNAEQRLPVLLLQGEERDTGSLALHEAAEEAQNLHTLNELVAHHGDHD